MATSVIGTIHYIFSITHQVKLEDYQRSLLSILSVTCRSFDLIFSMCVVFFYILNGKVIVRENQFLSKPPPDLCLFKWIVKPNQNI